MVKVRSDRFVETIERHAGATRARDTLGVEYLMSFSREFISCLQEITDKAKLYHSWSTAQPS
jgi:hypothetical protein